MVRQLTGTYDNHCHHDAVLDDHTLSNSLFQYPIWFLEHCLVEDRYHEGLFG
jgi:hypothetical protein